MKIKYRFLVVLSVVFFCAFFLSSVKADAATYYVATNGNDSNPGTISAPFKNWEKLEEVLVAGDTAYIRGGTYTSPRPASDEYKVWWQNLHGTAANPIRIWAYPGEKPVLDYTGQLFNTPGVYGLYMQYSEYVHLKGLRVTGLAQNPNGNAVLGFGLDNAHNNTIELMEFDHLGGTGLSLLHSNDNLILNSDSHHMGDGYSPGYEWGGTNGFAITSSSNTSTRNTFRGNRAWAVSDNGFAFFASGGVVTLENNWVFKVGWRDGGNVAGGDGVGYKLGPGDIQYAGTLRILKNNVAAENRYVGFDENVNTGAVYVAELYNNTAFRNGTGATIDGYPYLSGYNYAFYSDRVHKLTNNLGYISANNASINPQAIQTTNSWNGGVTVSDADFLSLSSVGMDGPRQADGSLPVVNFLKLASTSDLINAGTNVGLPYTGSAPDIGAFESGGTSPAPDTQAPTVAITVPISGVTVSGTINQTATASDNVGVTKVDFYNGTTLLGTDTTSPYNYLWDTTTVSNGSKSLTARAYDAAGNNTTSSTVTITVSNTTNTAPTANAGSDQTITLPTNSTTLTGSGTDTGGSISSYLWTKVSTLAGTITSPSSSSTTITGLAQGTHTFRLTVTDNGGLTASDDVSVTVNPQATGAQTYYLSPTGNDNNSGTISAPFKTIEKLASVLAAGDIGYVRGGTYRSTKTASGTNKYEIRNLNGTAANPIRIEAYQNEKPIFNMDNLPAQTAIGFAVMDSNYLHLKGFEITGLAQCVGCGPSIGFQLERSDNNIVELFSIHHIGGYGLYLFSGSDNNLIKNVDAYYLDDRYTGGEGSWHNSNGFNITGGDNSTNNTFEGCRSWWVSDDGWDFYNTDGFFTIKNSWAFWNGYEPGTFTQRGEGVGFKIGPHTTNQSSTLKRVLTNNLGVENAHAGFDQNGGQMKYKLHNNTAYGNEVIGYAWGYYTSIAQDFKNNLAFNNPTAISGSEIQSGASVSNNSWNGGVTVTNADFLSVASRSNPNCLLSTVTDTNCLNGPRQSDGSLPNTNFLKLAPTSDLINTGTNVGLPYTGSAPDIGAFESGGTSPAPDTTAPTTPTNLNGTSTSNSVSLTWTASTDAVGVTGYKIYRNGTQVGTSTTTSYSNTGLTASTTYSYTVSAYDAAGNNSAQSTAKSVTTLASTTNTPPVANAGIDQTITLPTNSVTLTGSGTDTGGSIVSYAWAKISGPTVTMTNPSASVLISDMTVGSYVFRLTVTDNQGATGTDDVSVTLNTQPTTGIFSIGQRVQVYGGTATVRATPTGTKLGTQPVNALGTILGGPVTANNYIRWQVDFDNSPDGWATQTRLRAYTPATGDTTAPTVPTNLNGSASSTSQINLTWTASTDAVGVTGYKIYRNGTQVGTSTTTSYSNTGLTASTTYSYTVSAYDAAGNNSTQSTAKSVTTLASTTNTPPVANAGPDQTITLPTNSVTVNGSATDANGNSMTYAWTKVSGGNATITSPTSLTTTITGLAQGTYIFWLTVTDSLGATNADQVVVVVNGGTTSVGTIFSTSSASPDTGYGYYLREDFGGALADTSSQQQQSTLRLFENGVELAPAHSMHADIRNFGQGRFSHWNSGSFNALWFSASNNSDPRTNGKVYSYIVGQATTTLDTTAPSIPTNLNGTPTSNSVSLTWTASTDNVGVTGYKIYRNGTQVGTSATTSYSNTGLTVGTTYSYTVSAYDAAGNNSAQSTAKSVTTQTVGTPLSASTASPDGGYGYFLPDSFGGALADNLTSGYQSTLRLYENGIELTPAHSPHADIRNIGQGRFSHWGDAGSTALYFSASNNSDPRTNGKVYSYLPN